MTLTGLIAAPRRQQPVYPRGAAKRALARNILPLPENRPKRQS